MSNDVISHNEMCRREGVSLQRGMNFGLRGNHSVILASVRPNSPYADRLEDEGSTLIYEGHDHPRGVASPNPKLLDQPEFLPSGRPTENGKFHAAAQAFKRGQRPPERVRVYEKLKKGIWSYNGVFHLVDSWVERDAHRAVFKFKLVAVESDENFDLPARPTAEHRRLIPTEVKVKVWKCDGGRCQECGATDELHFDHVLPFSLGGSSITAENVQLLCARHNIAKSNKII